MHLEYKNWQLFFLPALTANRRVWLTPLPPGVNELNGLVTTSYTCAERGEAIVCIHWLSPDCHMTSGTQASSQRMVLLWQMLSMKPRNPALKCMKVWTACLELASIISLWMIHAINTRKQKSSHSSIKKMSQWQVLTVAESTPCSLSKMETLMLPHCYCAQV